MSGVADKARFYLEQSVPQLREFEEKKIFNKGEIRSLVKKRSDFEHKILARGSRPIDFARYAVWEINLEHLRQKRCKRLAIKGSSSHAGQARIFLIFDRGTKKHPGDVGLWMSYLEYAREVKAIKKFKTVMTAALRLHPTKAPLWLYAAKWALALESDMSAARSYMQRGTRFCPGSKELWIEYAKLEVIYLAKISARRRILGLDRSQVVESPTEATTVKPEDDSGFATSEDVIQIPDFKTHTLQSSMLEGISVDTDAAKDPLTTPALNGAIPLTIYDHATKQPFFSASVADDFFSMFASFTPVHCRAKVLQHVLDGLLAAYPSHPSSWACYVRQPIIGIDPRTATFPMALAAALERLEEAKDKTSEPAALAEKTAAWVQRSLALEGLDVGVATVLRHTLRKLQRG